MSRKLAMPLAGAAALCCALVFTAVPARSQATVTIKEWVVPTADSHPHDPLAAADGSIWWTGQLANLLGRLDPKTGAMKEYPLRVPGSGPHGLVEDSGGQHLVHRQCQGPHRQARSENREVTEYPMPDPAVRDPHTPIFDQKGTLWFTAQGANMIGRLDAGNGRAQAEQDADGGIAPYGIVINSKGMPFIVEFGANRMASRRSRTRWPFGSTCCRIPRPVRAGWRSRATMSSGTRTTRAAISAGSILKTKEVKEWPSPGGPQVAALRDDGGQGHHLVQRIGGKPNRLVRFDPKTEKFQTWPIPSGGGVVRNMMATRTATWCWPTAA